ncbi:antiterminator Q family protein [Pseudomonas alloputida]|uniref:antiterminator Q family protein n=1 Tax=Pseudomonas alloputida TaxID=1940621 RepID=UPI003209C7E3
MMIRKPAGRPLGDTEYLLEQWGRWRLDGAGIPIYTSPSFMLIQRAELQPSATKNYCITDDWALAIDNAVARLAIRDQQMGDIIWLYYGVKWPMLRVGKHYGISEGKARELVRAGAAWIDCVVVSSTGVRERKS